MTLYVIEFVIVTIVWIVASAAVWTLAEKNYGATLGRSLGIAFGILTTLVALLALSTVEQSACNAKLDLEICD